MEQLRALTQMESTLSLIGDHCSVLSGKLEGLLFRAHRIANARKEDPKARVTDTMFGYDLQNFRRDIRALSSELEGLATILHSIERYAQYDEASLLHAQAVMRLAERTHKGLGALLDQATLAHGHIREAEHKVEAWYLIQEIEAAIQQTQALPGLANKVIIGVGTMKGPPEPAPRSGPAVPLRPAGRIASGAPAAATMHSPPGL